MNRPSYSPADQVVFPTEPSPDDVETTASDIQRMINKMMLPMTLNKCKNDTDFYVIEDLSDNEDALKISSWDTDK